MEPCRDCRYFNRKPPPHDEDVCLLNPDNATAVTPCQPGSAKPRKGRETIPVDLTMTLSRTDGEPITRWVLASEVVNILEEAVNKGRRLPPYERAIPGTRFESFQMWKVYCQEFDL